MLSRMRSLGMPRCRDAAEHRLIELPEYFARSVQRVFQRVISFVVVRNGLRALSSRLEDDIRPNERATNRRSSRPVGRSPHTVPSRERVTGDLPRASRRDLGKRQFIEDERAAAFAEDQPIAKPCKPSTLRGPRCAWRKRQETHDEVNGKGAHLPPPAIATSPSDIFGSSGVDASSPLQQFDARVTSGPVVPSSIAI